MSRITACALAVGMILTSAWLTVHAQETEEAGETDAPQILTSDLAPTTKLQSADPLSVDFVIVDSDNITSVSIDGEPQQITPGPTVVVTKEFVFTKPRTRVAVTATDEAGNTRTVGFLVLQPGVERTTAKKDVNWFVQAAVAIEVDDNPSNDLSAPIDVGVDVEGVVPDDEQTDTRTTLRAIGGLIGSSWNAFLGASQQSYADSGNENFETTAIFLGAGWRTSAPKASGFVARYQFLDLDIGGFDYAQRHTVTPGYEIVSEDNEGMSRDFLALDIILKDFAKNQASDTTNYTLKWVNRWRDSNGQDSSSGNLRLGESDEGFEESEFQFLGVDQDWLWRWDAGFRFELGWGWEYRNYPNDEPLSEDTPLGDTRVDNLVRLSLGPGWQFTNTVFARLGYRYMTNLSNKSPYVRQIYGLTVQATF